MNEFERYHPIVNFIYFIFAIGLSMIFMHPITLFISLLCGLLYSVVLNGKKSLKYNFLYMLPIVFFMAAVNAFVNREGNTVIGYMVGERALTAEAVIYGFLSALMLVSVICHFSCFNKIVTSDKIMFLLGKISPAFSLIFTMVLRFVPRFKRQLENINNAQKYMGSIKNDEKFFDKVKNIVKIFSVMTGWSFENSVETADSMRSRGYGVGKRSSYSNFEIDKRDIIGLIYILVFGGYVVFAGMRGSFLFEYFPVLKGQKMTAYNISAFIAYFMLYIFPIIIEIGEMLKWKKLKSKI